MQFLKRMMLKRLLKALRNVVRESYNPDEALQALTALRKVINSDNPIEYFSVRSTLAVRLEVQTHCAEYLVEILHDINEHLMMESGNLPEPRVIYRHLSDVRIMTLYDWLVDKKDNVLDAPSYYRNLARELNLLCDLVFQADDIDRDYILRKLTPLYSEILRVFIATLDCGLRSI